MEEQTCTCSITAEYLIQLQISVVRDENLTARCCGGGPGHGVDDCHDACRWKDSGLRTSGWCSMDAAGKWRDTGEEYHVVNSDVYRDIALLCTRLP